ncbi:MAG: PQQ-dependent sugar dehydrogenase [Actinomycetota bacterium]|nr:PQQ-dependent sugar dehydrogenase [Actinomycetota bacterium]
MIAGHRKEHPITRTVLFKFTATAIVAGAALSGGPSIVLAGPAHALPAGTEVRSYKQGLAFPVDMAWVRGTRRIFFTEKNTGKVRVMRGRTLLADPCVDLDVANASEQGALGIVLHPRFETNHFLYVYYTNATPLENRVARFVVEDNVCTQRTEIVTGIPAQTIHNGGQIEFMHGKLFVATGDANVASNSQNLASVSGKILRYNADGTIPEGNPFTDVLGLPTPVWSYGHRNPFGLAHRFGTRQLFETENGPDCDDELNLIQPGRNYGWGLNYECGGGVGPNPVSPLWSWTPPIVVTDPTWYEGRINALSGSLYVPDFGPGQIHRFRMSADGSEVRRHRVVHHHDEGILDVSKGPGRWLYFLTTNEILRIVES